VPQALSAMSSRSRRAAPRDQAPAPVGAAGPAYPIESVDRALSVILAFEQSEMLTIAEIGRMLDVSRSTAYRLLSVLHHRGFVRQDPRTRAFHAGTALLRVGLSAAGRSDVRATLRPLLEDIVARTGETAHLVLLDDVEASFVDCVESPRMVRATSRVGTTLPAQATAGGKVLLAGLPPAELDDYLATSLVGVTPRTKTSAAVVRAELINVAERGWALNDGESEAGLRAVAVLVSPTQTHAVVQAAVTVAGPSQRMDEGRIEQIASLLVETVARFTAGR
jgi:IclR family acetate operon transcriptional repressor